MPDHLLILSPDASHYHQIIAAEGFDDLEITSAEQWQPEVLSLDQINLLFGLPSLLVEAMPHLPNLRWVQSSSAGVNEFITPTQRHDVPISHIKDVFGPLMAEYVFAYILGIERAVFESRQAQRRKDWYPWQRHRYRELSSLSIGIMGVGSIGSHIAKVAKGFGMTVYGLRKGNASNPYVDQMYDFQNLHLLLGQSDFVVSVLPQTPETIAVMNVSRFEQMKADSIFINVGRGSVCVEQDLINALDQGLIKQAVLDVFNTEPLPADSDLWHHPKIFITPHNSAVSFPDSIAHSFIENLKRERAGLSLMNVLDFDRGY